MIALLFLLLVLGYLAPVVPIARRRAWSIQQTSVRLVESRPDRKVTKNQGYGYVYINGHIMDDTDPCQTCGGDKDYHPNGAFEATGERFKKTSTHQSVCNKWVPWDGEKSSWPAFECYSEPDVSRCARKALVSSLNWPFTLAAGGTKRAYSHIGPNWEEFAIIPEDIARDRRIKQLEEENDRLERELHVGPYSKENA